MTITVPPCGDTPERVIGHYPLSFSFRTAEEVDAEGVLYTNIRAAAYAPRHRSPDCGYFRGMILTSPDGGESYRVLVATCLGGLWSLRLEAVHFDGDSLRPGERGSIS